MGKQNKKLLDNIDKFNQSDESLIARHKTKLSSEFSKHDEPQISCSAELDNEWANESENIQ